MFGTDGIRGFPNKGLFVENNLVRIGYSFGIFLKLKDSNILNIFLSKDTRESSDFIEKCLTKGINKAGLSTIKLGVLPTSSLSIFTNKYPYSAGIMITASHNSSEYNGIKFINKNGEKISTKDEKKIKKIFETQVKIKRIKTKNIIYKNSLVEYVNEIIFKISDLKTSNLKYCVDVSNGASYKATRKILENLNQKFSIISAKPNGMNINKKCGVEHLAKIGNYVRKNKLNFGVSIDGDADRIVFVNKHGKLIEGDKIIAFIAESTLKKGSKLTTTIMTNSIIEKRLSSKKIEVLRTDVGDKNVYQMMKKVNSSFGGENSGHYIISNLLQTSDANLTLLYILHLLTIKGKDFDFIDKIKLNSNILKSYNVKKKKPLKNFAELNSFIRRFNKTFSTNGYLNIRYSGTENKIRILIQGLKKQELENEIKGFEEIIKVLN